MRFIFRLIPGVYVSTRAGCFSCCMLLLYWPLWVAFGLIGLGLYVRFSQYPALWTVLAILWVGGLLFGIVLAGATRAVRASHANLEAILENAERAVQTQAVIAQEQLNRMEQERKRDHRTP